MQRASGGWVYERAILLLADAAARQGIEVDLATLAPTRRTVDHDAMVPAAEYETAVRAIFAAPRENLGIELAGSLPVEAAGLWGFLLRSSPTFGDLLQRAERYIRIAFRYTRLVLVEKGDALVAICDHPSPSPFGRREQEVCFFLGQWLTWGRKLVGDAVTPDEVRMRWSGPRDAAPLDAFFRCPVRFGAPDDALVFSSAVSGLRLPEQTPELGEMFKSYAAAMIRRISAQPPFVDLVRETLSEGLLAGTSSEAAIAKRLGITARTLHRRLAEQGTSFRQLRSELLLRRAEELLREEELPISEVAYLLGYSEPSNFHRAFRRWTGVAPTAWRNQAATTAGDTGKVAGTAPGSTPEER